MSIPEHAHDPAKNGGTSPAIIKRARNEQIFCIAETVVSSPVPFKAAARELRLIYDIPSNHPRVRYFATMATKVAMATGGRLRLIINPEGKVHPGYASIEALKMGDAELTFVNASNLERLDPRFGFINLPFTVDDAAMTTAAARGAVVALMDELAIKQDLRVIGLMRGADQLFIFKNETVATPNDLTGLKIRVAGYGIYQDIMRSLSAEPVVLPIPEMKPAFERGALDGVFTSPGAWLSQLGMAAPQATLAPGLMMITYVLIARKDAIDRLPSDGREALFAAARDEVTDAWSRMEADDVLIQQEMVNKGAKLVTVTEIARWQDAMAPIARRFAQQYPELWGDMRARLGASTAT